MQAKYDMKGLDVLKRLNKGGIKVGELTTLLSGVGQPSLPGKSCIAAYMIAKMKAKNVK